MKVSKHHLLLLLQLLPHFAFAHGQEVLFTFFLPIIPLLLFVILLSWVRLHSSNKKILLSIYGVSLCSSFLITKDWPYYDNRETIDLLVTLLAPVTTIAAYFLVRPREKALPRKEVKSFLEGSSEREEEDAGL